MGADKTNNIMTLSSGVSQPLLADVQYFELYSSSALNRKLKNIVLPGFYCGFEPVPGTGLSVRITSENSEGKGAASVDVNNVQISVQQIEDVTVSVKAGATNIIVLEANFEHGVKTTQVESASSVSAARIYARTDNTIGQNQIELCRVIVPNGATAVTKEMIVLKYRVNRAVGVEFSNEISSTEERKAATPLAVKTLHDLVDTKAPLDSPHLSGTPTSPTPEPGTNNTQIANAAFVKAAITALINGAPGTLDTLKEIAAAINNDPNFSTTINNALALKAPLASPALTGIPTAPTAAQGTNNTQIATTAYVRAAISALVGSSPEALDTLNELAAALGNDPNFATTMTNALAGKQPLDATLTALAALATGANKLPYFTGKDTVAQTDLTSVGRDILAKTSTLAVIQYLGLGEGSALPVGVPVPWPLAVPPAGWLKCNGAAFTASQYPQLALAYPSLRLPDLRGEFIRGWDDGRGVDSGRTILSFQEGTIVSGFDDNDTGDISSLGSANYGFGDNLTSNQWNTINGKKWIFDASNKGARRYDWWAYVSARPRNIAFNYIVRAA
ncbi:tail fiber protein [Escherichia coli]|nr:tail fiber protein [Escherichia coli]